MRRILALLLPLSIAFPAFSQTPDPATLDPVIIVETPGADEPIEPVVVIVEAPECPLQAPAGSTAYEINAWNEICDWGQFRDSDQEVCVPEEVEWGDPNRPALSHDFMRTILTSPDYVAARPDARIAFHCVFLPELFLEDQSIPGSLSITDSYISNVSLQGSQITGSLEIATSRVGNFYASGLSVGRHFGASSTHFVGNLWLRRANVQDYVGLQGATIDGELDAYEITVGRNFVFGDGAAEHLDLRRASIGGSLFIDGSSFLFTPEIDENGVVEAYSDGPEGSIHLFRAHIGGDLDGRRATIDGRFLAEDLRVDGGVWLNGGARVGGVFLERASIGGNLDARDSVFTNNFLMNFAQIGGNLDASGASIEGALSALDLEIEGYIWLREGATIGRVVLNNASIGGNLNAQNSSFSLSFNASRARVGGYIFLGGGASFNEVQLIGTSAYSLSSDGSTFTGLFNASGLSAENVFLRNGNTFSEVRLLGASIIGHLQLQGSRFEASLDLSEISVGSLLLWRGPSRDNPVPAQDVIWGPEASLILRNAHAGSLQARMTGTRGEPDSWTLDDYFHTSLPRDLSGFQYDQLGGITSGATYDLAQIDPDILIAWVNASALPGMTGYRPQPYGALEDALRNMGAQAAATEVAYARLKHRANTRVSADWRTDFFSWVGQHLIVVWDRFLQITVGFGVYPYYAFFWFLGLVITGTLLARPCTQLCKNSATKATWGDSIFYSLENAIPLMEPSTDYAKVEHSNYIVRMFFNFQKVSGFVLATVLIGALTLGG